MIAINIALIFAVVGLLHAMASPANLIGSLIDQASKKKGLEMVTSILQTLQTQVKFAQENKHPIGMARPLTVSVTPTSYAVVKYFFNGVPGNACPSPSEQSVSIGLNVCLPVYNDGTSTMGYTLYSSNTTTLISKFYSTSDCSGTPTSKQYLPIGSCYGNIVKAMAPAPTINYGNQLGFVINAYGSSNGCLNQGSNLIGGAFLPANSNNCILAFMDAAANSSIAVSCSGSNVIYTSWNTSSTCAGTPVSQVSLLNTAVCTSPANEGYVYGYPFYTCNGPAPSAKPTKKPTPKPTRKPTRKPTSTSGKNKKFFSLF